VGPRSQWTGSSQRAGQRCSSLCTAWSDARVMFNRRSRSVSRLSAAGSGAKGVGSAALVELDEVGAGQFRSARGCIRVKCPTGCQPKDEDRAEQLSPPHAGACE
jgi:hypothetical protein